MKRFSLLHILAGTAMLASLGAISALADDYDKKTIVTLDQPTEVPGIVLQPGKYVIKLLNSSSNRHITEILNEKMDHLYALTFTVAAEKVQRSGKTVLTFYEGSQGRPQAMHGSGLAIPLARSLSIRRIRQRRLVLGRKRTSPKVNFQPRRRPENRSLLTTLTAFRTRGSRDCSINAQSPVTLGG